MLPEELFPMQLYIGSYILQNVHFEQNPQGKSSQSKSQSHSGKVGYSTRINCLEPIVLKWILVENNMFVYSELLSKYHGNKERYCAWWKKEKMPSLWETEKEKECKAGKGTEMLAVTGVFFCDFYFLAVWWGKCESRAYCEGEDGAVFLLIPETHNNYFNTYIGALSYKQSHCWVARSLAVWDGTLILSLLEQVFQFCTGCFPCQS